MDQRARRGALYKELRRRGWKPERHYRDYTNDQLLETLRQMGGEEPPEQSYAAATPVEEPPPSPATGVPQPPRAASPDPGELPGQRLNTKTDDDVIRVDDQGRAWLQEEVKKPAYPKPRGRRVLTYRDTGVAKQTVQNGDYTETFEISGDRPERPSEVKITLPSYQVGIYKDPRFPFKIHTYDGREGFNLFEVEDYFGGAELVPRTCKRIYIENDLCYDIRSVVQTIDAMYRELVLTGKAR